MRNLIIAILVFFVCNLFSQDIIHKKDDKILAGKVIFIDSNFVHFIELTNPEGPEILISKTEVAFIKFDYSSKRISKNSNYLRAKNAVSIGIGGTGGIFSLNYDRSIYERESFFLSSKVGIGSWMSQTNINFHFTGNYSFRSNKHYFEFGLGGAVGFGQYDKYFRYYASVPIIGYRIQSKPEGFFFRTYACGFLMLQDFFGDSIIAPMLGIDFGFNF